MEVVGVKLNGSKSRRPLKMSTSKILGHTGVDNYVVLEVMQEVVLTCRAKESIS